MPAAYPKEFRDDGVAVARRGDMTIKQVARGFGIAESCLRKWLAQDDVEAGARPGVNHPTPHGVGHVAPGRREPPRPPRTAGLAP